MSGALANTNSNVTILQGNVTSLTGALANTNSNVSNANAVIANLSTSITGVAIDLSNTNSNVTSLTGALANTNSNVTTLTTSVSGITSNVANLSTSVTGLISALSNTNSNVANLTTSVTGVVSNLANTNANVANTDSNVAAVSAVATTAAANTVVLQGNVVTLTNDIANTNSNVANTNSNVAAVAANVANLQGQTYGNANVAAYLPTYTGNLNAGNAVISGNLQVLGTTVTVNASTLSVDNVQITAGDTTTTPSALNGGGFFLGNNTGGNTSVASLSYTNTGNAWLSNLPFSAAGNITAPGFAGNTVSITGNIDAGNVRAGIVSAAGTITGPNLTATANVNAGNLRTTGSASASGIVYGGGMIVSGSMTATGTVLASAGLSAGNVQTTGFVSAGGNIITAANLSVAGSITSGNISLTANVQAGGFVSAAGAVIGASVSTAGNVNAGNIRTAGLISAAGNVTGNYFFGNAALMTGIPIQYSNANVASYLLTNTGDIAAGNVSATGNVTATILQTSGTQGNVLGANVVGAVTLSASGLVYGNGYYLTGIAGSYTNSNVAAYLATATGTISGSTLTISGAAQVGSISTNTYLWANGLPIDSQGFYGNPQVANYLPVYSGNINSVNNIVANNIQVNGTLTTVNTTNLNVSNIQIGVGTNSNVASALNTAGLFVGNNVGNTAVATFLYNFGSSSWQPSLDLTPTANAGNSLGTSALQWNNVYAASHLGNTVSVSGNVRAQNLILSGGTISTVGAAMQLTFGGTYSNLGPISIANTLTTINTGNLLLAAGDLYTNQGIIGRGTMSNGGITQFAAANAAYGIDATSITGNQSNVRIATSTSNGYVSIMRGGMNGNVVGQFGNTGFSVTGYVSATLGLSTSGNVTTAGSVNAINLLTSAGGISTAGNVTAAYFLGNVANATGLPTAYSNANVASYLLTNTANIAAGNVLVTGVVSTTGNITGDYIVGLSELRSTTLSITNNASISNALAVTGNVNTNGNLSAAGNIRTAGLFSATGNVTGGNLISLGALSVTSTVFAAGASIGSGGILATSNITGANLIATTAITAAGNIAAGGSINTGAILSAAGNVFGNNVSAGNLLTSGVMSSTGNIITLGNINATQAISATGNLAGGNIRTVGLISATGNITVGNIATAGLASVAGNVLTGNISTTGNISVAYTGATTVGAAILATGSNTQGGTNYFDFIKVTNTGAGVPNPSKFLRIGPTGAFEVINSAYTATLASLTNDGNLTVLNKISVNDKQAVNGPAFSAYANSTQQAIPSGAQTKVLFQSEEYDTDGCFASSRFTPTVAGYYHLNSSVRIDGPSGTGENMLVIYKNGTEYKRGNNESGTEQGSSFYSMQVSSLVYANGTTDYFEIYIQQTSGSSKNLTAVNAVNITWFNGSMVRGA